MPASASFSFEEGIRTVSCIATLALRIRVSMSAIGSVIVIAEPPPSPARLRHAGQLAGVRHLPDADAAQPEVAVHRRGRPHRRHRVYPRTLNLGLRICFWTSAFLAITTAAPHDGTGSRRRRVAPCLRHQYGRW